MTSYNYWNWGPPSSIYTWSGTLQSTAPVRNDALEGALIDNVIFEGTVLDIPILDQTINPNGNFWDGDIYFNVTPLNNYYQQMLSPGIYAEFTGQEEPGVIHCEIEPSCQGSIPVPVIGDYVFMVGTLRLDAEYKHGGWSEIHPVRLLTRNCNPINNPVCNLSPIFPTVTSNLSIFSIIMGQGFSLTGTATDTSGNPMPNTVVWAECTTVYATTHGGYAGSFSLTTTDSNGNFSVTVSQTPFTVPGTTKKWFTTKENWLVRAVLPEIGSVSPYQTLTIN